jgi:hypothetical protein
MMPTSAVSGIELMTAGSAHQCSNQDHHNGRCGPKGKLQNSIPPFRKTIWLYSKWFINVTHCSDALELFLQMRSSVELGGR